jgi:hypothetical protein
MSSVRELAIPLRAATVLVGLSVMYTLLAGVDGLKRTGTKRYDDLYQQQQWGPLVAGPLGGILRPARGRMLSRTRLLAYAFLSRHCHGLGALLLRRQRFVGECGKSRHRQRACSSVDAVGFLLSDLEDPCSG